MKQLLLFIALLCTANIAYTQEYSDVEFEVKKADRWHSYIYSDSASPRAGGGTILLSGAIRDSITYQATFSAKLNDTFYSGVRFLKLTYENSGDTVYANIYYGNNAPPNRVCVFIKNGIAVNAYPIASKLFPPFQDKLSTVYYGGAADISVADSTYKCIKLIEATPFIERGYWLHIKGARLFKYKRNMYNISIQYIRENDYLPVKMVSAAPVKQYLPETKLLEKSVDWLLKRVD